VDNAIGYVMTSTGTYGKGYYGDHDFPGINPIESLNKNNYATYEVNWQGGHGWASGNKGLGIKKMMCAYNELARWVHAQIPSSKPLCATGNSGGSLQISNTLVSPDYNTGENIFTHVVLTGGPPAQPDLNYYCDGFTDINNVDGVIKYTYNINEDNPWCQNMERPYKIEEFFKNDSLVRDDGIYNYNTSVSFIQGELDENVPDDALIYFNAITSEKSWTVLENTGHGVYKSKFGAPAIVNDLIDHCQ
jgi:hypothetical protein